MSIGKHLAKPLRSAASGDVQTGDAVLGEALEKVEVKLALPEGVEGVLVGRLLDRIVEPGYAAVSMSLIVIPDDDPTFCIVVAVASDGRVVAAPSDGNPTDRCGGSELIDLN